MQSRKVTQAAAAAAIAIAGAAGAQVQSHTIFEWPAAADFVPNPLVFVGDPVMVTGGVEITDFPVNGEIVDTRVELTLHNVPSDFNGFPLDAAHAYMGVTMNAQRLDQPFIVQSSVLADSVSVPHPDGIPTDDDALLELGFSGTGGPMTANVSTAWFNGDWTVNFWRVEWGSYDLPDEPVNYGPVSGRIVIDYIPCLCERTGDSPLSVDVFDLLAFLDQWFALDPAADVDDQPGVNVFDLLEFLDCWFAPC